MIFRFHIEVELLPGDYEFKFVVDNEWRTGNNYEIKGQNNYIVFKWINFFYAYNS